MGRVRSGTTRPAWPRSSLAKPSLIELSSAQSVSCSCLRRLVLSDLKSSEFRLKGSRILPNFKFISCLIIRNFGHNHMNRYFFYLSMNPKVDFVTNFEVIFHSF